MVFKFKPKLNTSLGDNFRIYIATWHNFHKIYKYLILYHFLYYTCSKCIVEDNKLLDYKFISRPNLLNNLIIASF